MPGIVSNEDLAASSLQLNNVTLLLNVGHRWTNLGCGWVSVLDVWSRTGKLPTELVEITARWSHEKSCLISLHELKLLNLFYFKIRCALQKQTRSFLSFSTASLFKSLSSWSAVVFGHHSSLCWLSLFTFPLFSLLLSTSSHLLGLCSQHICMSFPSFLEQKRNLPRD